MNPSVSIHPLANKEYLDAVIYYRDLDSAAAARFIDAYERAVTEICRNPGASPAILAGIRRKLLRRFPYSIFYYFTAIISASRLFHINSVCLFIGQTDNKDLSNIMYG